MSPADPGPRAMRKQSREWEQQRLARKARAAAQKAAREARAYDDYPGTTVDLIHDQRALRLSFYARQSERRAA